MKNLKKILDKHLLWLNNDEKGEHADLSRADLRGADLRGADLSDANVSGANLRGADLRGADLSRANLSDANVRGADLSRTDLRGADLSRANLSDANVSDAFLPIYCKWNISLINDQIQIGCKRESIEKWNEFFASDEVYTTPRNTPEFTQIQAAYNAYKAYYLTLNPTTDEY